MTASPNPAPGFAGNPAKRITVGPLGQTVAISAGGATIATSSRAKLLTEQPYAPVIYIPFEDIDFSQLEATDHSSHCPYKGIASYWTVRPAGERGRNAMWAYRRPYDEMESIRDHGAFYADRVSIEVG